MSAPAHAGGLGQCLDVGALFDVVSSDHVQVRADRYGRDLQPSVAAQCLEPGAQCGTTPQATSEDESAVALDSVAEAAAVATAVPCLLEEVEGRCAEADEKDRVESIDEEDALAEPTGPPGVLVLACFNAQANCHGLPAPAPHKQLKSPMPTMHPDGVAPARRKSGWWRSFDGPMVVEAKPCEGVRSSIDRPPRR